MRATLLAGCALALAVNAPSAVDAASRDVPTCRSDDLAFSLPAGTPPSQTEVVLLAVVNVDRQCRLELPVTLALELRDGSRIRTSPARSELTLAASRFDRHDRAWVSWTYANYCGEHNSSDEPIVLDVRLPDIELRGFGGTPPCNVRRLPTDLRVFRACPGARGPAIRAILPRPMPLCASRR
jgi:hypothetical protein